MLQLLVASLLFCGNMSNLLVRMWLQVLVHESHLSSGALDKIQAALQEAGVQVRCGGTVGLCT